MRANHLRMWLSLMLAVVANADVEAATDRAKVWSPECMGDDSAAIVCKTSTPSAYFGWPGKNSQGATTRCDVGIGGSMTTAAFSSPLNILHVGAYNNNVGDNLALDHVQHHVSRVLLPYLGKQAAIFHLMDIDHNFLDMSNSVKQTMTIFSTSVRKFNVSMIIFGGGGLLQPGYQHTETGWRLPINKKIIDQLQGLPFIVYGVGINTFRGEHTKFTRGELKSMREAILGASAFSVRNDGSYEELLRLFPDDLEVKAKVREIADPGMMLPAERCHLLRHERLPQPSLSPSYGRVALQPAWNGRGIINQGRLNASGLQSIAKYASRAIAVFVPHTPTKDYNFLEELKGALRRSSDGKRALSLPRYVLSQADFRSRIKFERHAELLSLLYSEGIEKNVQFDTMVPMRGHSLYLCIALNIPCIALSTQDKVSGFARKCGLNSYLVDVQEYLWEEVLSAKVSQLQQDAHQFRSVWHQRRQSCLMHWNRVNQKFHEEVRDAVVNFDRRDSQRGCAAPQMREIARWRDLRHMPQPAGLEAALTKLQRVAESRWQSGMTDRNGRRDPILGSSRFNPAALDYYFRTANQSDISTICEVGYNWGASALVWLHANTHARVFTFDLAERPYTNATLDWLNSQYNGRLTMIAGDSDRTIPWLANSHAAVLSCDLVFVDGAHSYAGELSNILNFQRLARCTGSHYIMDDCSCTESKLPTTMAFEEAVRRSALKPVKAHKTIEMSKASQQFKAQHEQHSFCAGIMYAHADRGCIDGQYNYIKLKDAEILK